MSGRLSSVDVCFPTKRHDAPCTAETCAEASGILGIQAAVIAAAVVEVCLSVTTATICCCWAPPSTAQVMPMSVPYTIQVVPQSPNPAQPGGRLLVPQPQFYLPNQVITEDIDFKKTTTDEGIVAREDVKKSSSSQTPPPARDVGCNTQDKLIPWLGISAEELENARATLRPPPTKKAWAAAPRAILRRFTKQQNGHVWPLAIPKRHATEKKEDGSGYGNSGPNPSTSKGIDFMDIGSSSDDKMESKPPTAPSPPPSPLPGVVIE